MPADPGLPLQAGASARAPGAKLEGARPRPSTAEVLRAALWIGMVGFGGGLSVLANIRALAVERRRWLTEREFSNTITVSQMLPGGAAANALAYIGLRFGGLPGALAGYAGFIFPGWAAVMALAWAYVHFGTTPNVETVLGGFNAAVVGIIVSITLKMVRTSVGRLWQMGVAAGALLFSSVGNAGPGEIALVSAGIGMAVDLSTKRARLQHQRRLTSSDTVALPEEGQLLEKAGAQQSPANKTSLRSPALVGFILLGAAAVAASSLDLGALLQTALVFFRTGLGAYGGGFAIVPHLQQVMERHQWLTSRQFADAVAIGKLTPGPVLLLATFIGYVLQGPVGAIVATISILAAPFILIVLAGSWLDRLRSRRPVRAALRGLTPAVLGLMAAAAITLGGSLNGEVEIGIAAAVALTLGRFEINPAAMLAVGGIGRLLLHMAGV